MTKKKLAANVDGVPLESQHGAPSFASPKATNGRAQGQEQHLPLTISRNKHWRYISAFHGPWLQLPHEILETLAHTNYLSSRPRQTDPGVLFDLLKIRKLVDEAADLAVRAQNGTASSALANADNGLPGSALGLSYRGAGGNAKLSPERKYRMRELATQKLSQAYRLDEVAASVATMQSASTLDSVASLVLQRAPGNTDAKYVHFFHEKIPSRMMAEYTSLTPLDEVIAFEEGHAAPYRTRALTKIFKEDYMGAVRDLTEALQLCRIDQAKHKSGKTQLITLKAAREEADKRKVWTRDWMQDNKVSEEDQPKGIEMQLLFQRGNQYLTMACQYIRIALEYFKTAQRQREQDEASRKPDGDAKDAPPCKSSEEMEAYQRGLEAREMVRKNAKRALRDYTTFFCHLDYAHAPADDASEEIFNREAMANNVELAGRNGHNGAHENGNNSTSLIQHSPRDHHSQTDSSTRNANGWPLPAVPAIYDISMLLTASPPSNLPPFPPTNPVALTTRTSSAAEAETLQHNEMITYHPLLPETLHSLLLTHCLLQTPPTTLLRIANNVARLARLADGYPFFLSARSPARADWSEIVRKTGNWIELSATWETLCKIPTTTTTTTAATPSSATTTANQPQTHRRSGGKEVSRKTAADASSNANPAAAAARASEESKEQTRDRIHKEAVMEALGDERVVDDATFHRAVEAREKRAWRDLEAEERGVNALATPDAVAASPSGGDVVESSDAPPRGGGGGRGGTDGRVVGGVARDEQYLIGTERAEAVARWVLEAPVTVSVAAGEGVGGSGARTKRKKKGNAARGKRVVPAGDGAVGGGGGGGGGGRDGDGEEGGARHGDGEGEEGGINGLENGIGKLHVR